MAEALSNLSEPLEVAGGADLAVWPREAKEALHQARAHFRPGDINVQGLDELIQMFKLHAKSECALTYRSTC